MVEALFKRSKDDLGSELRAGGYEPAEELSSIVLVGGKGTRLDEERKRIDPGDYPALDGAYHGTVGPKGMAILEAELGGVAVRRPMTDWHLEIHAACDEVRRLTLALGTGAGIIRDYYRQVYGGRYKGREIDYLVEERPAGTLAPFIKLHRANALPVRPTVYANGDNLTDVDLYKAYLAGCVAAVGCGADPGEAVIDVRARVGWEDSGAYGTVELDYETGRINRFKEKGPKEDNTHVLVEGRKVTPINSGVSIVVNPARVYGRYFEEHPGVEETSRRLEAGELDYGANEAVVKYETAYQIFADRGLMVGVYERGSYWADLGTEQKIIEAERAFPASRIFRTSRRMIGKEA